MYAGESLSFVTLPHELAEAVPLAERDQEEVAVAYVHAVSRLLSRYPEASQSFESDGLTVVESSFRALFGDGSYLHLSIYSVQDDGGLLCIGTSAIEHSDTGVYLGGYLFELTGSSVTCSRHPDLDVSQVENDEATAHFSIVRMFQGKEMLYQGLFSEQEDDRQAAEQAWSALGEQALLALYEHDLGFGVGHLTQDDIVQLQQLLDMATPFTIPDVQ